MSLKSKGINAERELIHLFWGKNIPAVRVAGSGSMRYPAPDIIAGTIERKFAIECKSVKGTTKYIPIEEIEELQKFADLFGCEPWIGMRFARNNWLFLSLEDLHKTAKSYAITIESAKQKGLLLEELI
jgi:Holliday junction resolvase